MAAAVYTTDLVDIIANITSITGWTALGGGASGLGFGPDFAMQGTNAVDKAVTASEKGHVFGSGAITPGTNTHFFVWAFLATPGVSDTLANRGLTIAIGTSTTAYNKFHVEGSNTYGAIGRVGRCYPIRYVTTGNASAPYRTLVGAPTANPTQFGALANILGTVKSSNLGISAIRYGTGLFVTAGDSGAPATLSAAAAQNDTVANRWGILTFLGGSAYELQGKLVIGQTSAGTPTLSYFSDSNKSILVVDTPHSLPDFSQIIIDHASTQFHLSGMTIEAAGTNNPGQLIFNNASTVSSLSGCSFVKIGETTLRAGVTVNGCTWRQAGLVTTNGATLTNSSFSSSSATTAVSVSALSQLVDCSFTSDGTGHAVNLGTVASSTTMSWDCVDSGYAVTNGSSGNETILVSVSSGQTLTINVGAGKSTPTYYNTGAGSVSVVSGQVSLTITGLVAGSDVVLLVAGTTTPIVNIDANAGTSYTYSYTYAAGTYIDVGVFKAGYVAKYVRNYLLSDVNSSLPIEQIVDRAYY